MLKIGWFGTRVRLGGAPLSGLLTDLAGRIPARDVPDEFLVHETDPWHTANLGGWEYQHVHKWAQLCSQAQDTLAVSIITSEGHWEWRFFDAGLHVAGMDSSSATRTFLYGDLKATGQALGVPPSVFKAYCRSWLVPESLALLAEVAVARVRAFPGDESNPWDEWANTDFARRLGLVYPEPSKAQVLSVQAAKAASAHRSWPTLAASLDPITTRCWPRRSLLETIGGRA